LLILIADNFMAELLRSGLSIKEMKKMVDSVYGDRGLTIDLL